MADITGQEVAILQAKLRMAEEYDRYLNRMNTERINLEHLIDWQYASVIELETQIGQLQLRLKELNGMLIPETELKLDNLRGAIAGLSPSWMEEAEADLKRAKELFAEGGVGK